MLTPVTTAVIVLIASIVLFAAVMLQERGKKR